MIKIPFREAGRMPTLALSLKWQWAGCALLGVACLLVMIKLAGLLFVEPVEPVVRFSRPVATQAIANVTLYPAGGAVAQSTENLTESSFNAQLLGVIHRADRSIASIAVKGQKEKVFRAGDSLASGVTLERIETNRVVIRERGALKQITLKSLLEKGTPIQVDKTGVSPVNGLPPVIATPVLGDEGISGLRVDQLNADIEALDLVHKGDLVVAVDGVGLSTLMADQAAIGRLSQRDQLSLTVIRNGQETSVDISGELIRTIMSGN